MTVRARLGNRRAASSLRPGYVRRSSRLVVAWPAQRVRGARPIAGWRTSGSPQRIGPNAQDGEQDCEAGHLDRTDRVARASEARAYALRSPSSSGSRADAVVPMSTVRGNTQTSSWSRRDYHEAHRVNRRGVQTPERHRRRGLKPPEHKPPHHWTSQRRAVRPFDCGDSHAEIGRQAGAGVGGTVSGAVAVGGSLPPGSSRKGGYESVINVAYARTRKTQRFIPRTKS